MYEKKPFEQSVGKTIKSFHHEDDGLMIVFTDETFSVIGSNRLGDETEIELDPWFDPTYWPFKTREEAFGHDQAMAMHEAHVAEKERERKERNERKKVELRRELDRLEAESR